MIKNKSRVLSLLIVVLMISMALAACGGEKTSTEVQATEAAVDSQATEVTSQETEAPQTEATEAQVTEESSNEDLYGGTMRFIYNGDLQRPNFLLTSDGPAGMARDISQEKLYSATADGTFVPRLATGYEASDDGLTYTVHLREGVKWQDGEPMTADDVVFYHEYFATVESVDKIAPEDVYTVTKIDDYTVQFNLEEPQPFFVNEFLGYQIWPEHIWKDVDPTQFDNMNDPSMFIGLGPFKFVEYKVGEYVRFERFDNYWEGQPYLDGVVMQINTDTSAAELTFESQQVDFNRSASKTSFEMLKDNPDFRFFQLPSGNMSVILMNQKDERLADLAVRKALTYLVDRQSMITAQTRISKPMTSCITSSDMYFDAASVDPEAFVFDIEKANQVLDEAGWTRGSDGIREKDGKRLEFEVISWRSDASDLLVIMMDACNQAGISLTMKTIDTSLFIARVFTEGEEDYDLAYNGMTMGPTPSGYKDMYSVGTYSTYINEEVGELFAQMYASTDDQDRASLMGQVQKIVTEDRACIWLLEGVTVRGTTNGLNMDDTGLSGMYQSWVSLGKAYFEK